MANPQAQANGEQESAAAEPKVSKKQQKKAARSGRWATFWYTRSKARTVGALILALLALMAAIYLALPDNDQAVVVAAIQIVGQSLGSTGLRVGVIVALVAGTGASLAMVLSPVRASNTRYLRPVSSVAPNITVLVDTENLAGVSDCPALLANILDYLHRTLLPSKGGKRRSADLLFFMDAIQLGKEASASLPEDKKIWIENIKHSYQELIFNGFRLINSPHDPTGAKNMKGMVDREIERVAFERALTSDTKQLFVIMSGDGDFAPLIYNLIALGHEVQMWTWGKTKVYDRVRKGVTGLTVEHFPKKVSNTSAQSQPSSQKAWKFGYRQAPEVNFTEKGERLFYDAIFNTVEGCKEIASRFDDPMIRSGKLNEILGLPMKQALMPIGFIGKGSGSSWIRCLNSIGALHPRSDDISDPGDTPADQAARQLFSIALTVARAMNETKMIRKNDNTDVVAILKVLRAPGFVSAELQAPIARIVEDNKYRAIDMRYLIASARALGLSV